MKESNDAPRVALALIAGMAEDRQRRIKAIEDDETPTDALAEEAYNLSIERAALTKTHALIRRDMDESVSADTLRPAFNALWDALSEIVEDGILCAGEPGGSVLRRAPDGDTALLHAKAVDTLERAAAERQEAV